MSDRAMRDDDIVEAFSQMNVDEEAACAHVDYRKELPDSALKSMERVNVVLRERMSWADVLHQARTMLNNKYSKTRWDVIATGLTRSETLDGDERLEGIVNARPVARVYLVGAVRQRTNSTSSLSGVAGDKLRPRQEVIGGELFRLARRVLGGSTVLAQFTGVRYLVLVPAFRALREQTANRLVEVNLCSSVDESMKHVLINLNETACTEFLGSVTNNPRVLHVVVADECHWAATKGSVQDRLLNAAQTNDASNFLTILVSATPFNVLSTNSRISQRLLVKKGKRLPVNNVSTGESAELGSDTDCLWLNVSRSGLDRRLVYDGVEYTVAYDTMMSSDAVSDCDGGVVHWWKEHDFDASGALITGNDKYYHRIDWYMRDAAASGRERSCVRGDGRFENAVQGLTRGVVDGEANVAGVCLLALEYAFCVYFQQTVSLARKRDTVVCEFIVFVRDALDTKFVDAKFQDLKNCALRCIADEAAVQYITGGDISNLPTTDVSSCQGWETMLAVYNLLYCRAKNDDCGPMVLVRVAQAPHGHFIVTLLRAVRRASDDFGVIGDFGAESISVPAEEERPVIKQPKKQLKEHCEKKGKPVPPLTYEALDGACIVVLCGKGRMGCTFPKRTFYLMDLRARKATSSLSTFIQELGRVCKYSRASSACVEFGDESMRNQLLPNTLLSSEMLDLMKSSVAEDSAQSSTHGKLTMDMFCGRVVNRFALAKLDGRVQKSTNVPDRGYRNGLLKFCGACVPSSCRRFYQAAPKSYDYGNSAEDPRRIVLWADPQSGKTGAYLAFLHFLIRKVGGEGVRRGALEQSSGKRPHSPAPDGDSGGSDDDGGGGGGGGGDGDGDGSDGTNDGNRDDDDEDSRLGSKRRRVAGTSVLAWLCQQYGLAFPGELELETVTPLELLFFARLDALRGALTERVWVNTYVDSVVRRECLCTLASHNMLSERVAASAAMLSGDESPIDASSGTIRVPRVVRDLVDYDGSLLAMINRRCCMELAARRVSPTVSQCTMNAFDCASIRAARDDVDDDDDDHDSDVAPPLLRSFWLRKQKGGGVSVDDACMVSVPVDASDVLSVTDDGTLHMDTVCRWVFVSVRGSSSPRLHWPLRRSSAERRTVLVAVVQWPGDFECVRRQWGHACIVLCAPGELRCGGRYSLTTDECEFNEGLLRCLSLLMCAECDVPRVWLAKEALFGVRRAGGGGGELIPLDDYMTECERQLLEVDVAAVGTSAIAGDGNDVAFEDADPLVLVNVAALSRAEPVWYYPPLAHRHAAEFFEGLDTLRIVEAREFDTACVIRDIDPCLVAWHSDVRAFRQRLRLDAQQDLQADVVLRHETAVPAAAKCEWCGDGAAIACSWCDWAFYCTETHRDAHEPAHCRWGCIDQRAPVDEPTPCEDVRDIVERVRSMRRVVAQVDVSGDLNMLLAQLRRSGFFDRLTRGERVLVETEMMALCHSKETWRIQVLRVFAMLHLNSGALAAALQRLQRAVRLLEDPSSRWHGTLDEARVLLSAATAYMRSGDHGDDVGGLLGRALALCSASSELNEACHLRGLVLNNTGLLHLGRSEYREALRLFAEALRIKETCGTAQDDASWTTKRNTIVAYVQLEEYTSALRLLDDLPSLLVGDLLNRGVVLLQLRRFEDALQCFGMYFDDCESDTAVALCRHNIGILLSRQGRFVEALRLYRQALRTRQRVYGASSTHVAATLQNMATAHLKMGALETADELYTKAFDALDGERVGGPAVAEILNGRAAVLVERGRFDDAMLCCERAVEIRSAFFGAQSAAVATTHVTMAAVHSARGQHGDAARLLGDALTAYRGVFGADSVESALVLSNLGALRLGTGELDEAVRLLDEARKILRARRADVDGTVLIAVLNNLAVVQAARRDADAAIALLELALVGTRLTGSHPFVTKVRGHIESLQLGVVVSPQCIVLRATCEIVCCTMRAA